MFLFVYFLHTLLLLAVYVDAGIANQSVPHKGLLLERQTNPYDFSWVNRWTAVGDSYTAAIGAGNLWKNDKENTDCSRYDRGYGVLVNNFLGGHVQSFQYPACSGARSSGILDQINNLQGDLDLVMMTAGGNDLCLAGILKTCILLPWQWESNCNAILPLAQDNIDTIFKPNIRSLLDALNPKMNPGSLVVYNLYSKFFDSESGGCESKYEHWNLCPNGASLPLTRERRRQFNTLAVNANQVIKEVVEEYRLKNNINFKIR